MNEKAQLIAEAVLGEQVHAFMRSDVGQYLKARIDIEMDEAIVELKRVDPTSPSDVMRAQNKVALAESIMTWLSQAIHDGLNATNVLEGREDE